MVPPRPEEAGAWEGAGAPCGRWARVSTQPCRGIQGRVGCRCPARGREREEVRNRGGAGWGSLQGTCPVGQRTPPRLFPGAAWRWWGCPASSSSAQWRRDRCARCTKPAGAGPCSSVMACFQAASVSFQCSEVDCTLESVPLHLEMRSPWRAHVCLPASRPAGATSREDSPPPARGLGLGGVCPHQGQGCDTDGNLRRKPLRSSSATSEHWDISLLDVEKEDL